MKYKRKDKLAYLETTDHVGRAWLEIFDGQTEFYSAPYWDLFVGLWRNGGSARKTDALKYMKTIKSAHTAAKYAEIAINTNLITEVPNPEDSRSKIVSMTPQMMLRIEEFLDVAVDHTFNLSKELADSDGCQ